MDYNRTLRGTESLDSLQQNASKHRNWRDDINWVFGNDPSAIDWATREIDSSGRVKVNNFDVLIGRSQPELQAAYEKHRQNSIRNSDQFIALEAKGVIPTIGRGTNLASLTDQLSKLTKKETLAEEERVRNLPGGANDQYKRQVNSDNRLATAQENANTLATRQQEQSEYQFDQNQRERAHNAEMARLDRKADRSDKKELFALQMQQNNLDRAYMRERDERADARADRDKRTAMLLQMVQGLSKLGYGMAI